MPGYFYILYLRRLWGLIRSRKDNPLILYGRARQSRWRRVLLVTLVLVAWAIAIGSAMDKPYDVLENYLLLFLFGTPPGVALCFFLFASPLRTNANLEDLHMTALSRDEVAFGAVWQPALLSVVVFVFFYLTGMMLLPFSNSGHGAHLVEMMLLFLVAPVILIGSLGIAVRVWISHGHRSPILLLFRLALLHFVSFFLLYALAGIGIVTLGSLFFSRTTDVFSVVPAFAVSFVSLGLFWIYQAGRFAGDRYFAPIDPEELAYRYWLANERLAQREKRPRREAMRRLGAILREGRGCDRAGTAAGAGLMAIGAFLGTVLGYHDVNLAVLRGAFGFYSVLSAGIVAPAVAILLRARGRPNASLPVVAGSLSDSTYRYFRRVWFPLLPLFLVGPVLDIASEGKQWDHVLALSLASAGCLFLGGILGYYVTFWLLPRGSRRAVAAVWIGAAVVFHLATLLGMESGGESLVFYYEVSRAATNVVLVLTAPVVYLLCLGGVEWIAQRLHDREVIGFPRHALTVEVPASPRRPETPTSPIPAEPEAALAATTTTPEKEDGEAK